MTQENGLFDGLEGLRDCENCDEPSYKCKECPNILIKKSDAVARIGERLDEILGVINNNFDIVAEDIKKSKSEEDRKFGLGIQSGLMLVKGWIEGCFGVVSQEGK